MARIPPEQVAPDYTPPSSYTPPPPDYAPSSLATGGGTGASSGGSASGSGTPGASLTAAPASATNIVGIQVKVVADSVEVVAPCIPVQSEDMAFIRPLPGNTKPVQVGTYAGSAVNGPYDLVAPNDAERQFPCKNTGDIRIAQVGAGFVLGEGISIVIRRWRG